MRMSNTTIEALINPRETPKENCNAVRLWRRALVYAEGVFQWEADHALIPYIEPRHFAARVRSHDDLFHPNTQLDIC